MPRQCHTGIKVENPQLTQLSQNEETRNIATSFLEFPTNLSGRYTYQCEPDEESARSWTYRSRVSDGTGGICCGPTDRWRKSHRFPSSKKKQQDEGVKIANEIKPAECIIPLSCRRQFFDQSLWGTPRWEVTPPRCCWRPQQETATTALRWWWHCEDWIGTSSNRDVRHPSDAWQ